MENRPGIVMQIELVLVKVSNHLPVMDLLHLRQTCTLWNHLLIPQLRIKHKPIQLINSPGGAPDTKSICDYRQLLSSSIEIPFGAYKVSQPNGGRQSSYQPVEAFLNLYCTSIQSLSFAFSSNDLLKLISCLRGALECGKLQQLTALEFHNLGSSNIKMTPESTIALPELRNLKRLVLTRTVDALLLQLISDLIQASPCLEEFQLNEAAELGLVGLSALRDFAPCLHKLTKLNVYGLTQPELEILIELANRTWNKLTLRSFSLLRYQLRSGATNLLLQDFLETQAPTLQEFCIGGSVAVGPWGHPLGLAPIPIPKLNHLRTLSFCGWEWSRKLGLAEGNLRYNFPQLRKLIFGSDYLGPVLEGIESMMTHAHPGVTELHINLADLSDHGELLQAWLPCVVNCQLLIDTGTRIWDQNAVWTTWPALEILSISYVAGRREHSNHPLNLDDFLSGIPVPFHEGVRTQLLGLELMSQDTLRELLRSYKEWPGISDMQNLKKFVLEAEIYSGVDSCNWTDIGGYFGLAMTSQLQHVEIVAWDMECLPFRRRIRGQISTDCFEMIKQVLGPAAVIIV